MSTRRRRLRRAPPARPQRGPGALLASIGAHMLAHASLAAFSSAVQALAQSTINVVGMVRDDLERRVAHLTHEARGARVRDAEERGWIPPLEARAADVAPESERPTEPPGGWN